MSVKLECAEDFDNDVESGQCSEDEVQIIKKEKRSKKHKRKDKPRKNHRRKCSDRSSSESIPMEFFNPYSVNPGKFILKTECVQMNDDDDGQSVNNDNDITNDKAISETFSNLASVDNNVVHDPSILNNCNDVTIDPVNEFQPQELPRRRESEYRIDISGIDTVTSDLYHYLLDLGLSSCLVLDLLEVFNNEEEADEKEPSVKDEEDDDYEEEMINDIPIIDQDSHSEQQLYNGGYSPEHVNVVEPYKPQSSISVNYSAQPMNHIIDPLSIPEVGPRDPRLNLTKTLLQMKPTIISKPVELNNETVVTNNNVVEVSPIDNKEWETTVVNVVKTHLNLYLAHNDINKDEYKSILKRAVTRIITCGERKLETEKISKFLHSYVTLTQRDRRVNNI